MHSNLLSHDGGTRKSRRDTKKEDEHHPLLSPLPYGGVRGGFPSSWEGLGVGSYKQLVTPRLVAMAVRMAATV